MDAKRSYGRLIPLLSLVLLTACSSHPAQPFSGVIDGRRYVPASSELIPIPITNCISTGKSMACTTSFNYISQFDPEHYQIKVNVCQRQKCKDRWVTVSPLDYQNYKDGDTYDSNVR